MTGSAIPQIGDGDSRAESVKLGARLTILTAFAGVAYTVGTPGGPHRLLIAVLFATAALLGSAALVAGAERIVASRHRDGLMLAWAVATIALTGALAAADGGPHSALSAVFFLPLAFIALSFPLASVVVIGAADVLTFVGVGIAAGTASQAYLAFFATCLAITAVMCAWAARNNDRRQAALERVSRADPLTGCFNRRGFEERLEAELDESVRGGRRLGLVTFDLDDFKAVNDSRGHAVGDELLRWTVACSESLLRPMDSLGRMGGDEFAVILPGAGIAEASEVASRLAAALSERVLISTGVACFPTDGADSDDLFRRADDHLYAVKRARRATRESPVAV